VQIEETPLQKSRITYLPLLNPANRPAINQGDVFMNQNIFTTNGAGGDKFHGDAMMLFRPEGTSECECDLRSMAQVCVK